MSGRDGAGGRGVWLAAALAYALLIVYGSLFPLAGWTEAADPWGWLSRPLDAGHLSRADLLVNVLAYVPLGLGLGLGLALGAGRGRVGAGVVVSSTLAGALLSFAVESIQAYIPSRVPAVSDLATNTFGTLVGAVLAPLFDRQGHAGQALARWRANRFEPGRAADVALAALALWALAQLSPLVPSFDVGNLRQGVAPIARFVTGTTPFNAAQAMQYLFMVAALALLLHRTLVAQQPRWTFVVVALATVLALKIPMLSRQLSVEMLCGLAGGIALAAALSRLRGRALGIAGMALLGASITVEALAPGSSATRTPFNWVPFRAHLANPLVGIDVILGTAWSAIALACFARFAGAFSKTAWFGLSSTAVVGSAVFALEFAQQSIPGRTGDLTTALIAAGAWLLSWYLLPPAEATASRVPPESAGRSRRRPARGRRRWLEATLGTGGLIAIVGAVRWAVSRPMPEGKGDKSLAPKLPAPGELAPAHLPGFRFEHPRLPHPSEADIDELRRLNPRYLEERRREARGGAGPVGSVVISELADPGGQDLGLLLRRLLDMKLDWRGHEQGKALALAYDWLHDRWSADQRDALRAKLVEGSQYLIGYIREERLSPYNVYLYNSPFQALVACSLALYGDDPRGDPVMAFTADLWKNRVLPVWRQIMGRNGGWHEGGEYVGIGIGQAVYQVPAMWRAATGEDLFAAEPGIRGFVDFLLHRTLPDGSHFRWGDGAFFDKSVPDAVPLAIEYGRADLLGLWPARPFEPAAWPWGPLTRPQQRTAPATLREPLTATFDGIGMLVTRSGWGDDATHVSFKAGDNFWSHVHLDQGAFTIHRGGPLAIDSGLYDSYGSAHHLNYHYQTVAHNTITVTDPEDDVPMPAQKDGEKPRPIANDGGQRRIGSGWGVERAPLDLDEWRSKRAIYHTGRIVGQVESDGISAVLADLTAAYTNEFSGKGSFSHRTRRVERCWRFFAYDRVDDVVVVYDDVQATRAAFRKRWLLHSVNRPEMSARGFTVTMPPRPSLRQAGGELEAHVVLPERPLLNAIGGPGMEFYVDGRNYDIGADAAARLRDRRDGAAKPVPGAWRIELSPEQDAVNDRFLVVMVVGAYGAERPHGVRRVQRDSMVGVEVVGPTRTTRWWFSPGRLEARFDVVAEGRERSHRLGAGS